MIRSFILFLIFYLSAELHAQEQGLFEIIETESWLQGAFIKLYNSPESASRDSLNTEIIAHFKKILVTQESFFYPWNELKMIGKVRSNDNRINIFTWHLEKNQNDFEYYGILQVYDGKKEKQSIRTYILKDQSTVLKNPETLELVPEKWYGVLYYGIQTYKYKRKYYYALLGYDFNNQFSDKKLIDVLMIDKGNLPVFGGSFQLEFKTLKRVIFEYSDQVVMTMRYDERLKMIVVDHLSPIEPLFTNNYRFYSPDGIYDGFQFVKGVFILQHDIDARNDKSNP